MTANETAVFLEGHRFQVAGGGAQQAASPPSLFDSENSLYASVARGLGLSEHSLRNTVSTVVEMNRSEFVAEVFSGDEASVKKFIRQVLAPVTQQEQQQDQQEQQQQQDQQQALPTLWPLREVHVRVLMKVTQFPILFVLPPSPHDHPSSSPSSSPSTHHALDSNLDYLTSIFSSFEAIKASFVFHPIFLVSTVAPSHQQRTGTFAPLTLAPASQASPSAIHWSVAEALLRKANPVYRAAPSTWKRPDTLFEVIDIKDMDSATKESLIQRPVYELYRQIYRGPLYDTPYFCNKKFVDPAADVFVVGFSFAVDGDKVRLVGANVLKVTPYPHDNRTVAVAEYTAGYLPEFRGKDVPKVFSLTQLRQYYDKHPDQPIYYFDLLTSPISYNICLRNYPKTYPRFDGPTPKEFLDLMTSLLDKMPHYEKLPNSQDPFVRKGAQVREPALQLYTRLTRGQQDSSPHTRFFYERTKAVNSYGILTLSFIERHLPDEILDAYAHASTQKNPARFAVPVAEFTDFAYLLDLRSKLSQLTGTTTSAMIPQKVTIELLPDDFEYYKDMLAHIGYVGPIQFCGKMEGISYRQRADILSSRPMKIVFKHDGHPVFAADVPLNGFNTYTGPIGAKFVELILHGDIAVTDKYVLDLGCGCGNAGLAAIVMGARNVIFSDISADYLPLIRQNPLVVEGDHDFQAQSLVTETLKNVDKIEKYDVLMMSTPTFNAADDEPSEVDNTTLFQSKKFLSDLIDQGGQILKTGGEMVIWVMFADFAPKNILRFLRFFKGKFDIAEFTYLSLEPQTNIPVFSKDEASPSNFYMLYRIKKTSSAGSVENFEAKLGANLLQVHSILAAKGLDELAQSFKAAGEELLGESG